jgi:hypothetical protein
MAQRSSSINTQPIPLYHMHTPTHNGLEMMSHDVSLGSFLFFIILCLTYKWYSTERFVFISLCFCLLHHHTFSFKTCNFLAALTVSLNCAYNFANSIQNSGCTCRQVLYITCYFKRLTNEFQLSWLEIRMPCHALFSLLSTCRSWFGSAQFSGFGLVWHFTHEILITSHIQAPNVRKKPCFVFE